MSSVVWYSNTTINDERTPVTDEELKWLRDQLHSVGMQCKQCDLTRRVLDEVAEKR